MGGFLIICGHSLIPWKQCKNVFLKDFSAQSGVTMSSLLDTILIHTEANAYYLEQGKSIN